jgi:hypothetical protein
MQDSNLKKRLIEAYLLEGSEGETYRSYRNTLLAKGYRSSDLVELIIAARLYRTPETFYRKNPHLN